MRRVRGPQRVAFGSGNGWIDHLLLALGFGTGHFVARLLRHPLVRSAGPDNCKMDLVLHFSDACVRNRALHELIPVFLAEEDRFCLVLVGNEALNESLGIPISLTEDDIERGSEIVQRHMAKVHKEHSPRCCVCKNHQLVVNCLGW